jgi:hypothetical protein
VAQAGLIELGLAGAASGKKRDDSCGYTVDTHQACRAQQLEANILSLDSKVDE